MNGRTEILSVHWFRRTARRRERAVQRLLDTGYTPMVIDDDTLRVLAANPDLRGVRVRRAGAAQWAVEATEGRGH